MLQWIIVRTSGDWKVAAENSYAECLCFGLQLKNGGSRHCIQNTLGVESCELEWRLYLTLSSRKGKLLISLVTENTTYTTFDVVYTKMLYTQQVSFSQSDKSCLYRDTSCISTNTAML